MEFLKKMTFVAFTVAMVAGDANAMHEVNGEVRWIRNGRLASAQNAAAFRAEQQRLAVLAEQQAVAVQVANVQPEEEVPHQLVLQPTVVITRDELRELGALAAQQDEEDVVMQDAVAYDAANQAVVVQAPVVAVQVANVQPEEEVPHQLVLQPTVVITRDELREWGALAAQDEEDVVMQDAVDPELNRAAEEEEEDLLADAQREVRPRLAEGQVGDDEAPMFEEGPSIWGTVATGTVSALSALGAVLLHSDVATLAEAGFDAVPGMAILSSLRNGFALAAAGAAGYAGYRVINRKRARQPDAARPDQVDEEDGDNDGQVD